MSTLKRISDIPQLPSRAVDSHKGSYGRVVIIGGSVGMSGAISLAGLGALRGGAGLVYLACPKSTWSAVALPLGLGLAETFELDALEESELGLALAERAALAAAERHSGRAALTWDVKFSFWYCFVEALIGMATEANGGFVFDSPSSTVVPTTNATTLAAAIPATPTNQRPLCWRCVGSAVTVAPAPAATAPLLADSAAVAYGFGSAASAAMIR